MRILMMTNTFTPHVGGVARSVSFFTEELKKMGHKIVVVAPEFEGTPKHEEDVLRIPAIQNFNGSDFSVILPYPGVFSGKIEAFKPEIVHTHHPFLIGSMALRVANHYQIPLVFTHHTMYEKYTHYVPGDSPQMKRFAINLSVGYSNLCDQIIAPSESVENILRERGVDSPIEVVPTGVYIDEFSEGDGKSFREKHNIPEEAFVIGHIGRLAPEKNLEFLTESVCRFMKDRDNTWFLLVGSGPSEKSVEQIFKKAGLLQRLVKPGKLQHQQLVDSYHAMDLFAFASLSETQGMVLVESMAAGTPVVALDANGVREVVRDGIDGYLVFKQDEKAFAGAIEHYYQLDQEDRRLLVYGAKKTAKAFSMEKCAKRLESIYKVLLRNTPSKRTIENSPWHNALEDIKAEWEVMINYASSMAQALTSEETKEGKA